MVVIWQRMTSTPVRGATTRVGRLLLPLKLENRKRENYHIPFYKSFHASSSSGVFQSQFNTVSEARMISNEEETVSFMHTNIPYSSL